MPVYPGAQISFLLRKRQALYAQIACSDVVGTSLIRSAPNGPPAAPAQPEMAPDSSPLLQHLSLPQSRSRQIPLPTWPPALSPVVRLSSPPLLQTRQRPVLRDVCGDECAQPQTFIQFPHQKQTTVVSDARSLEINFQRGVERELKGLILCFTHWAEASANLVLRPKPHQYWRWLDQRLLTPTSKRKCGMRTNPSKQEGLRAPFTFRTHAAISISLDHGHRRSSCLPRRGSTQR
jgi:hypothetical protein